MSTVPTPRFLRRRALLAALGLGAAFGRAAAASRVTIDGGVPQRLALSAIAELELDVPASIDGDPVELAVLTLGSLEVKSGRLVAADGLLLDGQPFTPVIAPGRYPLQLVLARLADDDERVAFVQLKLAPGRAVTWSNATTEDATDEDTDEQDMEGYDADSGTGCLFDAAAIDSYRQQLATDDDVYRNLENVLRSHRRPTWTWARIRTDMGSGFIFTAGYGDGYYGSYWGRDEGGAIVSLVTDFELLDWAGLPSEPDVTT